MTELAALVARRLCHDFAGPVGAISTALELLEHDDNPEILALIRESARGLSASLRLYRVILSPGETALSNVEARQLLADWIRTRNRIELDWQVAAEQLEVDAASTLLGLALIASEALARGGTLVVGDDFVEADGPSLRLDADVRESLDGASASGTPRAALVRLVLSNAKVGGRRVTLASSAPVLRLQFDQTAVEPA
ncbi:MAG: histidine phosphotransferase family protein [Polymorphobacter sp.]